MITLEVLKDGSVRQSGKLPRGTRYVHVQWMSADGQWVSATGTLPALEREDALKAIIEGPRKAGRSLYRVFSATHPTDIPEDLR